AVEPGRAADRDALAILHDLAADLIKGLAVVPRRLTLAGLFAVPLFAVQHQWPLRRQLKVVPEVRAAGLHAKIVQPFAPGALQRPIVDPGVERLRPHARLADAPARENFVGCEAERTGEAGVSHPDVGAVPSRL